MIGEDREHIGIAASVIVISWCRTHMTQMKRRGQLSAAVVTAPPEVHLFRFPAHMYDVFHRVHWTDQRTEHQQPMQAGGAGKIMG